MKKILLFLVLLVTSISLVYAATTVVDTVKPDILATFNESVTLSTFNLTYVVSQANIPLTHTTTDNRTFVFRPVPSLQNGFYTFLVNAIDRIGNAKQYDQNILVAANETRIFYITPRHGVAAVVTSDKKFDITIGTSRMSSCRWSFDDLNYSLMSETSFLPTGNLEHKITAFQPGVEESLTTIFVKCIDDQNLSISRAIAFGYDTTAPTISSSFALPNPVTAYPPRTNITINADDDVLCYVNGAVFSTQSSSNELSYNAHPVNVVTYPSSTSSNGQYSYQITCENLAESKVSLPAPIQVTVNLQEALAITAVNSPKEFIKNPLVYSITTNKDAVCNATIDGANQSALGSSDKKTHALNYGSVAQRSHNVVFTCKGGTELATRSITFTADDTDPLLSIVTPTACSNDKMSIRFNATDNQSGILGYNYSISGGNVSVNSTFTTQNPVEVSGLKLINGTSYSVKASAFNKAGGKSQELSVSFQHNPSTNVACQEKIPPVIRLNITEHPSGRLVTIGCFDESGCVPTSIGYGLSDTSNCSVQNYKTEVVVSKPQTICYAAEDIYKNKVTGSQKIEFKSLFASCSNGFLDGTETAVDCGGSSCSGCSVGLACNQNTDCAENYCVSNKCEAPLCTDLKQNGFESDIDCGGTSCESCSLGKSCTQGSDCASNYCNNNICEAASCTDGIKNGFESDIDCGGSCGACSQGKFCSKDTDCASGSCEFSTCSSAAQTFEDWARSLGIDPSDRDGDSDGDGLTNFEEFGARTDPFNADSDGDGVSDGQEIKDGTNPNDSTDFKTSTLGRYLLLALGLIALVIGVLFLYYFKADQQTSFNVILIGAAAIVFVLVDLLLFALPKPILYTTAVLVLAGSGYLIYGQQTIIVQKLSGKSTTAKQTPAQKQQQQMSGIPSQQQTQEMPLSKEEMEATKEMIEMIKKEKLEREKRKEQAFSQFGKSSKPGLDKIPLKELEKMETSRKEVPKKETAQTSKPSTQEKSLFDRLSGMAGIGKSSDVDRLERLGRGKSSNLDNLKNKDVFSKLPSSKKNISDLEELQKRRKRK